MVAPDVVVCSVTTTESSNVPPFGVIVGVMTDGLENASTDYTKAKINEMIKHQSTVYNWEFLFLGASQDAIAEGMAYGFSPKLSSNFDATPVGTQSAYRDLSATYTSLRTN